MVKIAIHVNHTGLKPTLNARFRKYSSADLKKGSPRAVSEENRPQKGKTPQKR
jgi:hypothetical protein